MTKRFIVVGLLVAGLVLSGCSGVTPSVKIGVLHTAPADSDTTDQTASAWAWTFGGSIEASFPETGPVIEPCASVNYTIATADLDTADITTFAVPSELCVEVETDKLRG